MTTGRSAESTRLAKDVHNRATSLLDDLRDLLDELETSYERQALLQRIDEAILRAGPDPAAILDFIIHQVLAKTSSQYGRVVEYRDDHLVVSASTDPDQIGRELPLDGSLCGLAVTRNSDQRVSDVGQLPGSRYLRTHADTRAELAVLIRPGRGRRVLGVLDLQRSDDEDYSDSEVAFTKTLTGQLAIAIQQTREREAYESIYDTLTLALPGVLGADAIYGSFVRAILRALNASYGQLMRWNGSDFMIVASSQPSDVGLRLSGSAVGRYVVAEGGTDILVIDDIARSPYSANYVAMLKSPKGRMRSEVVVPLIVEAELIGALNLESRRARAFTDFETHLLRGLQQPLASALHATSSQLRRLERERAEAAQLALGSVRSATSGLLHQTGGLVSESRARVLEVLQRSQSRDAGATISLVHQLAPTVIESLEEANETIRRLTTTLSPDQKLPEALVVDLKEVCETAVKRARRRHYGLEIRSEDRLPSPPRGSNSHRVISGARCVLDYQATELFLNLLDNAARAVLERWGPGSKGHVWLTLDLQDSSHARVRVADNGVGIAPDIRDRIFEYGFSGRPDRSQSYGVGLWWCSLYVQRHGGSLTIGDSDASGGAAFDVVLPLSLATRTEERTD